DSVRSLMVPSSGKMGLALISELAFDFDLTVINASLQHLNSKIPANVKVVNVNYIDEYKEAVFSEIKNSDGFISVAAVSDFIFEKIDNKISKNNSSGVLKYHIGSDV
ncbi:bifunctional phosphopantothenoylcysteine decarboxylase/phosphopantothenate--cysteine ligase CoaBC, partial [Mycoplasmopsis pullorum]